jgi:ActR/RegA family two-component response regulator
MADLDPARVVVNLAEPGALATLAALRAAGCTAGLWGCVAAAGRGLALGAVEPAARPLDPDAVVATLVSRASRGTRIVTVGADVDALVGLRYALTHLGMSVSMAWDARQAGELLPLVRPEVVVLDLGLAGGEGYAILARLAGGDALPSTILVPGDDDAAGLRAALAVPANAQRAVPLGRLLARMSGRG